MNRSTEEGISLVAAAGGVYNTWQAPQHHTIRSLAASFLSAVSNYHVPYWTQATAKGKNRIIVTKRDQRWERKAWELEIWWEEETHTESTVGGKGEKMKQQGNILTIRCRIRQRKVVQQEEDGGLIGSVKGNWAGASCQYQSIAIRLKCVATTF